jgi:hypothetical protein
VRAVRDAGLELSGYCRGGMFTSDPGHRIEVRDDNRRVVDEAKALGASIGGLGRANEHEITPGPKSSTNRHRLSPHSTILYESQRASVSPGVVRLDKTHYRFSIPACIILFSFGRLQP